MKRDVGQRDPAFVDESAEQFLCIGLSKFYQFYGETMLDLLSRAEPDKAKIKALRELGVEIYSMLCTAIDQNKVSRKRNS